jgi:hypothetical protein
MMIRWLGVYLLLVAAVWGQTPTHLVVDVQGQVTLKRSHWQIENPLSFGTEVALGDLLHLREPSARVMVLCADLNLEIISGQEFSSIGCSEQNPVLYYRGDRIAPVRTSPTLNLPRVLSPRATKLLGNRPTFYWEALEGSSYTVRLKKLPNDLVWETVTTDNHLPYPDKPPLEPGVSYSLEVEAKVGDTSYFSSAEGIPNLGFRLLDETLQQKVLSDEEKILGLPLSEVARAFVLAKHYAGNELYAEALEQLSISDVASQFSLQYALGKLYDDVSLPDFAATHFANALALAVIDGNIEGEAQAHFQLARLADNVRNQVERATYHYEAAKVLYRSLGDEKHALEVRDALERLQ